MQATRWWKKGEPMPPVRPSPWDHADFLKRHELVVTGRFHAVAFCLATHTPFVAVDSNTPKISSLVRDVFGDERRVIPLEAIANFDFTEFIGWADGEEERLDHFLKTARARINGMFASVSKA